MYWVFSIVRFQTKWGENAYLQHCWWISSPLLGRDTFACVRVTNLSTFKYTPSYIYLFCFAPWFKASVITCCSIFVQNFKPPSEIVICPLIFLPSPSPEIWNELNNGFCILVAWAGLVQVHQKKKWEKHLKPGSQDFQSQRLLVDFSQFLKELLSLAADPI